MRPGAAVAALGGLTAALALAAAALAVVGERESRAARDELEAARTLAVELRLTDLALWSEAGYCRHPTVADRFAAHADHPSAMEHFPAGSMVPPPRWVPSAREVPP